MHAARSFGGGMMRRAGLGSAHAVAVVAMFLGSPTLAQPSPAASTRADAATLAVFEIHYGDAVLPRTQTYAARVERALTRDAAYTVTPRAATAELLSQAFPRPEALDVQARLNEVRARFKEAEALFFKGQIASAMTAIEDASFKLDALVELRILTDPMRTLYIATQFLHAQLYLRDAKRAKAENVMEDVVRRVGDDPTISTATYHPEPVKLFKAVLTRLETARTGHLTIESTPEGADIYLNGLLQPAKTPATLDAVYSGSLGVLLVKDGVASRPRRVLVAAAGEAPQRLTVDLAFDAALQLESEAFGLRFADAQTRDRDLPRFAARLAKRVGVDYVALAGLHTVGRETFLEGFLVHGETGKIVRSSHADAAVALKSLPKVVNDQQVAALATFLTTGEASSASGSPWYSNSVGWVLTGAGVVSLVVGGVMYSSYLDSKDIAECDPTAGSNACEPIAARLTAKDDAETERTVAYALWGVGAVSLVGGILVFALSDDDGDQTAGADPDGGLKATHVAPLLTPDGDVGVSAGFRF